MFLLVSSSVRSKQLLCFVHGQGKKSEQRQTTTNFGRFKKPFSSINFDVTLEQILSFTRFFYLLLPFKAENK